MSAFLAQQEEGFSWDEYAPSVLRLPPDRIGEWPRILKEIYERLEQLDLTSILTTARQRWTSEFWKTTTDVLGQDPAKIDLEDDFDRAEQKSTEDFDMIVEDDDEFDLADEELEAEQGKSVLKPKLTPLLQSQLHPLKERRGSCIQLFRSLLKIWFLAWG